MLDFGLRSRLGKMLGRWGILCRQMKHSEVGSVLPSDLMPGCNQLRRVDMKLFELSAAAYFVLYIP